LAQQNHLLHKLKKAYTEVYQGPPPTNNQLEDESLATSLRESLEGAALGNEEDFPPIIVGSSNMTDEVSPIKVMNGIGTLSLNNLQKKLS
jgi:hypothetical protein